MTEVFFRRALACCAAAALFLRLASVPAKGTQSGAVLINGTAADAILIDGAAAAGDAAITGGRHTITGRTAENTDTVGIAVYDNQRFQTVSFSGTLDYVFPESGAEIVLFLLDSQLRPLRSAVRVRQAGTQKLAYTGQAVCYDEEFDEQYDDYENFSSYTVRLRVVTDSGGRITEIRDIAVYDASGKETNVVNGAYLSQAAGKIPAMIVEKQTTEGIDAVSGATCASHAILRAVWAALGSSAYQYIVWQFAPSAQHIIGEEFRELTGTDMSKKLASAVRRLDSRSLAFSTDFGADITIMEEATEFVNCFRTGSKKPFMTSCCPGWVNYVELTAPGLIPNLSSCKFPMEMLGSLIKSWLPKQKNVKAEELFHVAVMPCTAKKYERAREEMTTEGVRSVDAVLTVVEFKNLLMSRGIDLTALPDGEYDSLFAGTSGAGRIFGATGGVCEAAMRTAYYLLTGAESPAIEFTALRGNDGIKTAEVAVGEQTVRACVVNGIGNIKTIVESIRNGTCPYDFIEVMACRGGCSGGGGTPVLFGDEGVRHRGLYRYDAASNPRSSHHNETLSAIYADYLSSPCSSLAENLLHTSYHARR